MDAITIAAAVGLKPITDKLTRYVTKKRTALIKQNKRSDSFVYSGTTDKSNPPEIIFLKGAETEHRLPILFSSFNNRYNLFEPIGDYNLNSPTRQKGKDSGEKEYAKKYNLFHSKHIIPFSFREAESYKEKEKFLTLLTGDKRLIYITGSVGCGKSTFISHLIYFAKKEIQKSKNIAIISISAKELDEINNDDEEKAIYQIIEQSFHQNFKKVFIKNREDFKNVVSKHFKIHKLTIIIDDLDKIYDQSRALMLKMPEHVSEFKKYFKNKRYVHIAVKLFSVIKGLLDDNNNVNFIIGLRDETFEAINTKYKKDTGTTSLKRLRNPLCIGIQSSNIESILQERFKLGSLHEGHASQTNSFAKFFEFSNELDGLHINGTRHIISKLRDLSCIDAEQLFYKKWMLQLYVYLDGLQKYSQQACGILNIFLVNIDYRKKVDQYHEAWPEFTKTDHYQTFWLKYLICKHFNENIREGQTVDVDMVYEKFNKYEKGIFNFSLYSLTDTNHGRLISCSFDENEIGNYDYKLEKTTRLRHCFDKKIFFSFVYLSVIVNDDYLEIPRIDKLKKIFDEKHIYDNIFFVKDNQKWKEWLFGHIRKVLVFVKILESSLLYYEKEKISDSENLFPNFEEINNALEIEIKDIAATIDITSEEIDSEIEKTNNIIISDSLKKHFHKYSKFIIKKEKHME